MLSSLPLSAVKRDSKKYQNMCHSLSEVCEKSVMSSRHAAGIIKDGTLIVTGINHEDRSRADGVNVPSIHSEVDVALRYLGKYRREKSCILRRPGAKISARESCQKPGQRDKEKDGKDKIS